jgi:hypothetical protein
VQARRVGTLGLHGLGEFAQDAAITSELVANAVGTCETAPGQSG